MIEKGANLFPRRSSKGFERHAQASHPSSIRLLSKDRGLFFACAGSLRIRDTMSRIRDRSVRRGRMRTRRSAVVRCRSSMSSRLARSAGLISIATLASRVLGVARESVLASYFGASAAMDAYNVAFRIPNILRDLFAEGAMTAAFVPAFTRTIENAAASTPGGWATWSSTRCWSSPALSRDRHPLCRRRSRR